MKLKTAAVQEAVEAERSRRLEAQQKWDADVDAAEQKALEQWNVTSRQEWTKYRDKITRILKSGKVPRGAFPSAPERFSFVRGRWEAGGGYRSGKYVRGLHWRGGESHGFGQRPLLNDAELAGLVEFLKAITDEEISLDSLIRAGFKDGLQQAYGLNRKNV